MKIWYRESSRHFGLGIHPHVTLEEANESLRDHDLMAHLLYPDASVTKISIDGLQDASQYTVAAADSKIRVVFEQRDLQLFSHETLALGISVFIHWQIVPRPGSVGIDLLLVERTKLRIPRLVSSILPIKVVQAVSVKTRLITAAMEIKHRQPSITREELVRAASEMAQGINMGS